MLVAFGITGQKRAEIKKRLTSNVANVHSCANPCFAPNIIIIIIFNISNNYYYYSSLCKSCRLFMIKYYQKFIIIIICTSLWYIYKTCIMFLYYNCNIMVTISHTDIFENISYITAFYFNYNNILFKGFTFLQYLPCTRHTISYYILRIGNGFHNARFQCNKENLIETI